MSNFAELFRAQVSNHFRDYNEMIPNFDPNINPIFDKLTKIEGVLNEISMIRQATGEKCNDSCMNCSPELLQKLIGLPVSKNSEPDSKEETNQVAAPSQTQETKNQVSDEPKRMQEHEKDIKIVPQISEEEFSTIPKYQLGRFTLENLNEIVGKMDDFLMKKSKILSKTNKQLTRNDRELLDNWRELEVKSKKRLPTSLFFIESDIRPLLQERLRPVFSKAVPCLRHIRRIREERCGPLTFYYP